MARDAVMRVVELGRQAGRWTHAEYRLLICLADRMNSQTGLLNPSLTRLAEDMGYDDSGAGNANGLRSVRQLLQHLEKKGEVTRIASSRGGRGHSQQYHLPLNGDLISPFGCQAETGISDPGLEPETGISDPGLEPKGGSEIRKRGISDPPNHKEEPTTKTPTARARARKSAEKRPTARGVEMTPEELRIFEWWLSTLPPGTRREPTSVRVKAIRKARKGWLDEDILDAVIGWQYDPWSGRSEQNDLTQLVREKDLEKFRDLTRKHRGELSATTRKPLEADPSLRIVPTQPPLTPNRQPGLPGAMP